MARGPVGWLMVAFALAACGNALAQAPGAKPVQAPAAPAAAAPAKVAPPDTFTYRIDSRRDPFVSLVNHTLLENRPAQTKPKGARGLSWAEVSLVGIMMANGKGTAIVRAPDNQEYRLHVGDQLYDCLVKAITADTLTVLQEVNDPLSLAKVRERSKTLRVVEEVK